MYTGNKGRIHRAIGGYIQGVQAGPIKEQSATLVQGSYGSFWRYVMLGCMGTPAGLTERVQSQGFDVGLVSGLGFQEPV